MSGALVISVRFHDGRYHGIGHEGSDWPPAPARLFQALLAGAAKGAIVSDEDRNALQWLERLDPPVIAAPAARAGQGHVNYVPNNDLDSEGGDVRRMGKIRTRKPVKPRLFDAETSLLYAWSFEHSETNQYCAETLCAMAEKLYQFGRGADMAWASGDVLDDDELEARLAVYAGPVHRPSARGVTTLLNCAVSGSLASLEARYKATGSRFKTILRGKKAEQQFAQAPKPHFRGVAYDSPPARRLFDLRTTLAGATFAPWPLTASQALVINVRDAAAVRLRNALARNKAEVDRVLIGRNATEADKAARVRILPLPSVGHPQADRAIRRVLIEIPPDCPIPADDIAWAFSGLVIDENVNPETGEIMSDTRLVKSDDSNMLAYYGLDGNDQACVWRTITPVALPEQPGRRRIESTHYLDEAKNGRERQAEEARAAWALLQALRHVGIRSSVATLRVQREPFDAKGARVEAFASGTRFAKERLWHVEIGFVEAVAGPLVLGDGRYLGLGLMVPATYERNDIIILPLRPTNRPAVSERRLFLHAVRRALMARNRDVNDGVSRLFSGHEPDGAPARSGQHDHIFLAAEDADEDGFIDRLVIIAPWRADHNCRSKLKERNLFELVAGGLQTVRMGQLGVVELEPPIDVFPGDRLVRRSAHWSSVTPYIPTIYLKRKDARSAIANDLIVEIQRRGLPRPKVEVTRVETGYGGRVCAHASVTFAVKVRGPLMLGRDSHGGGGLFLAQDTCAQDT